MLRTSGERKAGGGTARREDFAQSKARRLAEREQAEQDRQSALTELITCAHAENLVVSDAARAALLELYARALSGAGGALHAGRMARSAAALPEGRLTLTIARTPGRSTTVTSPAGRLVLEDLTVELSA